ncbi:MAG: YggN family protein [Pseudomonadota bacterium]|nr:YggN family protein [Pseudomonadota bacterium]
MNIIRTTTLVAVLAALPLASACSRSEPAVDTAAAEASEATGVIGRAIEKEIAKARKELHEGNIAIGGDGINVSVNGKHYSGDPDDGRPRAEITPQGGLLIDGKTVATTPAQQAMLLEYRGQIIAVAETGMAIGTKAADLAGTAISESIGAIFSGNTEEIEKKVEAQAMKIKSEAKVICDQLPAMLATQQELAASLPEFGPYATMTQSDVDECIQDIEEEGAWSTQ